MKESNILVGNAAYSSHRREILEDKNRQYMKDSNSLADSATTGCTNWTEISVDLIIPVRGCLMKWERCPFSLDIRTFWYIVSKNSNGFHIFFTDWCVGGLSFWIFVKIHWNLRIKQTSVLFCKYLHNESSDLHEI